MCGVLKAIFHSVMIGCLVDGRRGIQLPDCNVAIERLGEYDSEVQD